MAVSLLGMTRRAQHSVDLVGYSLIGCFAYPITDCVCGCRVRCHGLRGYGAVSGGVLRLSAAATQPAAANIEAAALQRERDDDDGDDDDNVDQPCQHNARGGLTD